MSLLVNEQKVAAILLADGWHKVKRGSFYLDAYEFIASDTDSALVTLAGGQVDGVPSTGFSAILVAGDIGEYGGGDFRVVGPLTALLAVKESEL